jgi:hypothetical protein
MKTFITSLFSVSVLVLFPLFANAGNSPNSAVGLGARWHVQHSAFEDLPFEDGDLTYTLGYEYHDKAGYWQLLLGYTPEVGEGDLVDYVITPQLNLIIQDRIFLAGTGILGSYVESKDEGGDWTSVYWQFMLGFEIPLGAVKLEILAYYPFEGFSDLDEFDFSDIEYGGSLKYYF